LQNLEVFIFNLQSEKSPSEREGMKGVIKTEKIL